eukprot:TRINITY_DN29467_c0_g1_i1.p1 TRINITY_DN29467_c0_g1~~TRINITY_DN29467_c0_g1_i1.p1  ORF type:complete len:940 (+),score=115.93 TRINITY_DN29467_c0_g1_i1:27-2846(+)
MAPGPTCLEESVAERTSDVGELRHARLQSIRARRSARLTNTSDDDVSLANLLRFQDTKLDIGQSEHAKQQFAGPLQPECWSASLGDELPHTRIPQKKTIVVTVAPSIPSEDDPIGCESNLSTTAKGGSQQRVAREASLKIQAEGQCDPILHVDRPSEDGLVSARRSLLNNIKQSRVRRERLSKGSTLDVENVGSKEKRWETYIEQFEGRPQSQLLWEAHEELSQCAAESERIVNPAGKRLSASEQRVSETVQPTLKNQLHADIRCQATPRQPPKVVDKVVDNCAFSLSHVVSAAEDSSSLNTARGIGILTEAADAIPRESSPQSAKRVNGIGPTATATCNSCTQANRVCTPGASPISAQSGSKCNTADPVSTSRKDFVNNASKPATHCERFSNRLEHEAIALENEQNTSRPRSNDLRFTLQADDTADQQMESRVPVTPVEVAPGPGCVNAQSSLCEDARVRTERRQARREASRPPRLQMLEDDVTCARDILIDDRTSGHKHSRGTPIQGNNVTTTTAATVSITAGCIDTCEVATNVVVDARLNACSALNSETLGKATMAACDFGLNAGSNNNSIQRPPANNSEQNDANTCEVSPNCVHMLPEQVTRSLGAGQTSKRHALMDNLKRSRSQRESSSRDSMPMDSEPGGQSRRQTSQLGEYRKSCDELISSNADVECGGFDSMVQKPAVHSPPLHHLLSDDRLHEQRRRARPNEAGSPKVDSLQNHRTSVHDMPSCSDAVTSNRNRGWSDDCKNDRRGLAGSGNSCTAQNLSPAPAESVALEITHSANTDRVDARGLAIHGGNEHDPGRALPTAAHSINLTTCNGASNRTNSFNGSSDVEASAAVNELGTAGCAHSITAGIACSNEGSCVVHLPRLAESPRKAPDVVVPNPYLDDLKRRWDMFRRRDEIPANRVGNFRFRQRAEKQFPAAAECKDSALPKLS